MKWLDFVGMDFERPRKSLKSLQYKDVAGMPLSICSSQVVEALTKPALSDPDFKWCQWALSKDGGNVEVRSSQSCRSEGKMTSCLRQVGKSYGSLNGPDRDKYEQLSCNTVAQGKNPSCDDVSDVIHWSSSSSCDGLDNQIKGLGRRILEVLEAQRRARRGLWRRWKVHEQGKLSHSHPSSLTTLTF